MLKSVFILIFCITVSLTLSSCSEIEIVELNERLIIESIGIDEENGKYKVTIEGLDSFTAGSDSNSISGEALTKCYLFEGESIGMAMNSISVITGQIPLFSQARVLILGNETAETKLSEVLDFFRREYTTRTDILIAVAADKASDVIAADYGKNVSAGNILEAALSSYEYTGISAYTPLYVFFNSAMDETDAAYCPVIDVKKNVYTDKAEISISGTKIIGKNTSITISPELTMAMMIINNDTKNGDMTLTTEKGICTLEIIECKTKIKTEIQNKRVTFYITSELSCDIPEYQTSSFSGLSKSDTEEIALKASEKIAKIMAEVLDATYFKENFDIFAFGRRINLKDNALFEELLKSEKSISENVSCNIKVNTSIRRIGKVVLKQ